MLERKKIAILLAEVFGTGLLTLSILAITRSAIGIPYFVALGVGLTMALLVLTIGAVSGAHVNPAVTFGAWTIKKINTIDAITYTAAQFAGAFGALHLYNYLAQQAIAKAQATPFDWKVLVAEFLGTLVFTFGIAAAITQKYEGGKKAAAIGGSLTIGIIIAGIASGGLLNPAAALGVESLSRAYLVGPLLGGVVGMNLYTLLFAPTKSLLAAAPVRVVKTATPTKKKPATKTKSKK